MFEFSLDEGTWSQFSCAMGQCCLCCEDTQQQENATTSPKTTQLQVHLCLPARRSVPLHSCFPENVLRSCSSLSWQSVNEDKQSRFLCLFPHLLHDTSSPNSWFTAQCLRLGDQIPSSTSMAQLSYFQFSKLYVVLPVNTDFSQDFFQSNH